MSMVDDASDLPVPRNRILKYVLPAYYCLPWAPWIRIHISGALVVIIIVVFYFLGVPLPV